VASGVGKAVSVLILGTVNPPKCVDQFLGTGSKWVFKSSDVLKQVQNNLGESTFAKCATVLILNQIKQSVLLCNS
jgi:hypothetical protein